jgi:hypothetical protein
MIRKVLAYFKRLFCVKTFGPEMEEASGKVRILYNKEHFFYL